MFRLLFLVLLMLTSQVHASAVDVSGVGDSLLDAVALVMLVGGAVFGVSLLVMSYRWIRDALGGDASGCFASDAQRKHFFANQVSVAADTPDTSVSAAAFDADNMALYDSGHFMAYEAGLTNVRDKDGEASWSTEQWLAFDAGRDRAHDDWIAAGAPGAGADSGVVHPGPGPGWK